VADAIFISYRRDDSEGEAGRLFDDLTRAFGSDAVFMDVAGIKPGVDFRKAIEDNVASCGVFLAIVGPTWTTIQNPDGKRRLEDPNDFVALEIASALKREVPVIPVLVHDAKMPSVDLLPEALKPFAYRNSVEITHARWSSDVVLLIEALKAYVTPKSEPRPPVHATVPVQLPAPHPPSGTAVPVGGGKKKPVGLIAGIAVAAVLVLGLVVYFATRSGRTPTPDPNHPDVVVPATAGFVGTWRRSGGAGDSDALGMLVISGSGSSLVVHAYGRCQAPVCDWGSQPGVISGANVVATFSPSPNGSDTSRTAMVTAHPVAGGLDVVIHNNFQNPAGSRASNSHQLFTSAQ
jgi:hypothetical protein